MFFVTDIIMWNTPSFIQNMKNILHNIVSPAKHRYGSE